MFAVAAPPKAFAAAFKVTGTPKRHAVHQAEADIKGPEWAVPTDPRDRAENLLCLHRYGKGPEEILYRRWSQRPI
jgi:hypothetical protein